MANTTAIVTDAGSVVESYVYNQDRLPRAIRFDGAFYDPIVGGLDNVTSRYGWVYLAGQKRFEQYLSAGLGGFYEINGRFFNVHNGRMITPNLNNIQDGSGYRFEVPSWSDLKRFGTSVAIGTAVVLGGVAGALIGTFAGAGPWGTAAGFYVGSSLVLTYIGFDNRYFNEGQTLGQSLVGAPLDGFGASAVWAGAYNTDIITGDPLGLSPGERWFQGVTGTLSVLPALGVVGRGALGSVRGLSLGTRTWSSGGGMMGGAYAPAFAISYPVVTRGAVAARGPGPALAYFAQTGGVANTGRAAAQSYAPDSGVRIQSPASLRAQSQVDAFEYHHIFLKHDGFRRWLRGFVQNADGFDVHQYTVRLARLDHQVLHAPVKGLKGGFWEQAMREAIQTEFNRLGRRLSHSDLLDIGRTVARRFNIADDFVPYPR